MHSDTDTTDTIILTQDTTLKLEMYPARVTMPDGQEYERSRVSVIAGVLTIWHSPPGTSRIIRLAPPVPVASITRPRATRPERIITTATDPTTEYAATKGRGCGCGSSLKRLSGAALDELYPYEEEAG